MQYKDAKQVQQDIPYSSRRVYLPLQEEGGREALVHSKALYERDKATGTLRRVNKPMSKKARRRAAREGK